jgi:hypothetical protein
LDALSQRVFRPLFFRVRLCDVLSERGHERLVVLGYDELLAPASDCAHARESRTLAEAAAWTRLGAPRGLSCQSSRVRFADTVPAFPDARVWNREPVQRVGIVVELTPGSRAQAEELIAKGPPFDLGEAGFARHSILLGNDRVVFVFEGEDVERRVRDIVDDPVRSASLGAWASILAGTPRLVREAFTWQA